MNPAVRILLILLPAFCAATDNNHVLAASIEPLVDKLSLTGEDGTDGIHAT